MKLKNIISLKYDLKTIKIGAITEIVFLSVYIFNIYTEYS